VNKKNEKYFNYDIFLIEIFQNISKAKFTVIFISIFFLLLGVFYSKSLPKKFTTYALVQDLKLIKFNINPKIITGSLDSIYLDYYDNFLHQVTSSKTFSSFLIENNNSYSDFKKITDYESWAKNKITLNLEKKYLGEDLIPTNVNAKLIFTYSDNLKIIGPRILNDFIIYTEKKINNDYLDSLKISIEKKIEINNVIKNAYIENQRYILNARIKKLELKKEEFFLFKSREINNKIFRYKQALNVANNLDLKKPQRQNDNDNDKKLDADIIVNFGEERQLYNEGIIVLTTQIKNFNQLLKNLEKNNSYNKIVSEIDIYKNQLENLTLSDEYFKLFEQGTFLKKDLSYLKNLKTYNSIIWNPLLERATKSIREDINHIFVYAGAILGIFMSLLFIIIKILIQKNIKLNSYRN
tara:strand:- start:404 stop:1633 length:1230 start_codon:yes stop_codon:yes gene_type:complete